MFLISIAYLSCPTGTFKKIQPNFKHSDFTFNLMLNGSFFPRHFFLHKMLK